MKKVKVNNSVKPLKRKVRQINNLLNLLETSKGETREILSQMIVELLQDVEKEVSQ